MRVLWIGPNYRLRYNFVHEHLPDEAARRHSVVRYGKGMDGQRACEYFDCGYDVLRIIEKHGPFDLLVLQHPRHCEMYGNLHRVKIPKICLITDFFPRNQEQKIAFIVRNKFNLVCFPETFMIPRAADWLTGIHLEWLPFWVDTAWFRPMGLTHEYDVMALGSGGLEYRKRAKVADELIRLRSWSSDLRIFVRQCFEGHAKVRGGAYPELINKSEIAVATCDCYGDAGFKHFEYPGCGTLMFSDRADDFGALGFVPGENYVEYNEPAELPDLIREYLAAPVERARIRENALKLIETCHTVVHRCKELFDLIQAKL